MVFLLLEGRHIFFRSNDGPGYGEEAIPDRTSDGGEGDSRSGKDTAGLPPPDAWPVRGPTGRVLPGTIGCGQKIVDCLTWEIPVDEDLREPGCDVGGAFHIEGVPGEGERDRAVGVEKHPTAPASQLITGPLDEETARCEP